MFIQQMPAFNLKASYVSRLTFILIPLLLSLALVQACSVAPRPIAQKGVLNLTAGDLTGAPIPLSGQWRFYPQHFLDPQQTPDFPEGPDAYIEVPGSWKNHAYRGGKMPADGFGTYVLKINMPAEALGKRLALRIPEISSAHRIYLNGREISRAGNVAPVKAESRPGKVIRNRTFAVEKQQILLIVQVSNYDLRFGGLYRALLLGEEDRISAVRERTLFYDFFLFGALVIMGLYHLGLFINRREDRASLLFGVVCLDVALRALTTGDVGIQLLAPFLSFEWVLRLEYLTFYMGTFLVQAFFAQVFALKTRKFSILLFGSLSILFSLQVLFTPTRVFTEYLLYFQLVTLAVIVYSVVIVIMAIVRRQQGAVMAFVGGLVFALTIVHDMFSSQGIINTPFIAPLGLFFFIFLQAALLSRIFSSAFSAVRTLTDRLTRTNQSYSRFVPREFLDQLHKEDITDIHLGDQVQKNMTIFFADIRAFTELSESMTPQENFDFLNSYLKRMTPIVREMGGFIDKYIGDSIMALFPETPEGAIRTAVRMQQTLLGYNKDREARGFRPIQVGIGIHTGKLMLGTIGAEDRMEGTVISDSVNLAARIEQLTKTFGVSIIISEEVLDRLPADTFHSRLLGRVSIKGKTSISTVHQILDGYEPEQLELYKKTRSLFTEAVGDYHAGNSESALSKFKTVIEMHPEDTAAHYFLKRVATTAA